MNLENRISMHTKDVNIHIKMKNSIAELQLTLKQDRVVNEFNHKIYELMRSKIYTFLTSLFVQN